MTEQQREAVRQSLRSWRRRSDSLSTERDPLVAGAVLKAGLTIEEVHIITGLGRGTIDRILKRARENGEQS